MSFKFYTLLKLLFNKYFIKFSIFKNKKREFFASKIVTSVLFESIKLFAFGFFKTYSEFY